MVFKNITTRVKKSNSYILLIMSHNPAHQDAPTSQGTQPTPTVPPIALVYAFCYVLSTIYQRKRMLARANMHTDTCYLCTIPHARKVESRSNSRPQGLYLSLAKLCKAFAGAEDFIPCSQTPTCQRCRQCDYSSLGTVAICANRPGKKRSTATSRQQQ